MHSDESRVPDGTHRAGIGAEKDEQRRTRCTFPLAVDRNGKEGGTDWIDIVAWRGTAEVLCNYAGRGRLIAVDGRLQMRDWTDKNGNKRRSYEVQADSVYFADNRRSEGNDTAAPQYAAESAAGGFAEVSEDDGELPF